MHSTSRNSYIETVCDNVASLFFSGFETKAQFVIAMEYLANGELFDYVWKRQGLDEAEARALFAQIVEGVHYCHKVGTAPSTSPNFGMPSEKFDPIN